VKQVSHRDGSVQVGHGASVNISADVTVAAPPPAGRRLFGDVRLVSPYGTFLGAGGMMIGSVTGTG
jgi:hypothetical protein